jgi:short chain dehydrogenase
MNGDGPHRGRVALITGGSRGIGHSIAVELARRGAHVVIGARTDQSETLQLVADAGGEAVALTLDISDPASVEAGWITGQSILANRGERFLDLRRSQGRNETGTLRSLRDSASDEGAGSSRIRPDSAKSPVGLANRRVAAVLRGRGRWVSR